MRKRQQEQKKEDAPQHQQSRRVGPPILTERKGFFLTIPLGMWAILGTIAMLYYMLYDIATSSPVVERWY